MTTHAPTSNVVTYNTMAKAFTDKGMISKAESVIREMQTLGLRPTEYTCGIVMNGLCEEGDMEKALELVERMNSQGFPPNVVIFNTLIKGYARALLLDGIDEVNLLLFDCFFGLQSYESFQ